MKARYYGADPEVGVIVDNVLTPPAKLFELGMKYDVNKNNKKVILHDPAHGSVIEDGVSFEFNIYPRNIPTQLYFSLTILKQALTNVICHFYRNNYIKYEDIHLSDSCVEQFDTNAFLDGTGELYDDCRVFRCDQDFYPSIYKELGLETEDGVLDASQHPLRYFGGHLHIQNMSENPEVYIENAEYSPTVFDFLVGLTNVINVSSIYYYDDTRKKEVERMKVYGRPGRGRIQIYSETVNGYEYRPPSNNWIFEQGKCKRLFMMANFSADIVENGFAPKFVDDMFMHIPNMWEAILNMEDKLAIELRSKAMALVIKMLPMKLKDARNLK